MTNGSEPTWEATLPYPPRFWWLKRIVALALMIALGLAALRVWWGHEAQRRWERTLAELRGRGEPVVMADFQPLDIPDAENAAYYLQQATFSIRFNSPRATNMTYRDYPPFPKRWHRVANQAVAQNAKALQLVRQARACDRADWNVQLGTPVMSTLLPFLNGSRNLANLVGDAALHAHLNGDDFEAVERLRDLLAQARAVDQPPFLISHLVSIGIESLAHQRIQVIAAGMRIDTGSRATPSPVTTSSATRPAIRAQIKALVAELLARDEEAPLVYALQSERMAMLDTIDWSTRGNPLLRPMFQLDRVRSIELHEPGLRAATQPTWPAAQAVLASAPPLRPTRGNPVRLSSLISSLMMPATNRALRTDHRVRAERRLAAAALAVQLYRADHGRWPESLEAMVPEYLPAVPRDVRMNDQPIRFTIIPGGWPDGTDRPVVYSVGEDGRDDTIAGVVPPPVPQFGFNVNSPADQWRDLEIPRVATTQPVDDEAGDQADDEAEAD